MKLSAFQPLAFLVGGVLLCCVVLRAQTAAPQTTNFAPLDYFNDKCARCHGSYGSFYGQNFAKGKTDEQLAQVVKQMCDGPAQAPISEHDLEVLVAWHRALRDGKPFVASVGLNSSVLSGEASPGSEVSLETATGERTTVPMNGHKWRVGLPADMKLARVRVRLNGQTIELDPHSAAYAPK